MPPMKTVLGALLTLLAATSSTSCHERKQPRPERADPGFDGGQGLAGTAAEQSRAPWADACGTLAPRVCYEKALKRTGLLEPIAERMKALPMLRDACDRRVVDACSRIGIVFSFDKQLRDTVLALTYYERACQMGDSQSCFLGGELLAKPRPGDGLARDCRRAVDFYEAACRGKESGGCSGLGELYRSGCEDLPRNLTLAKRYRNEGMQLVRLAPP